MMEFSLVTHWSMMCVIPIMRIRVIKRLKNSVIVIFDWRYIVRIIKSMI